MQWKPWSITRFVNTAVSLVLCLPAIGVALTIMEDTEVGTSGWPFPTICLLIVASAILLAVNCFRQGVEISGGRVIVRGFVKTTRIPEAAVIGVDVHHSRIRWQKPDGTRKATRVSAFSTPPRSMFHEPHRRFNEKSMTEIQDRLVGHRRD